MSKRKNLNAYVRYDGNNKMIPGSLIFREKKPYGKFKEMINPSLDICCGPTLGCVGAGLWEERTNLIPLGEEFSYNSGVGFSVTDDNCNVYKLSGIYGPIPGISANALFTPLVEKFDGSGNLLWRKWIYFTNEEETNGIDSYITSIALGTDSSVYVVSNYNVTKLDLDGNIIWTKNYASTGGGVLSGRRLVDIVTPPSGRVYVAYQTNDEGDPTADWYMGVAEINISNGDFINDLAVSINTPGLIIPKDIYYGYSFTYDKEQNLVVLINGYDNVVNNNYVCGIYKLDTELNILWFKVFTPPGGFGVYIDSEPTSVVIDSQNNIILAFWWASVVMKLDSSGNILWQTFIGSTGFESEDFDVINAVVDENDDIYVYIQTNTARFPEIPWPLEINQLNLVTKISSSGVAQFCYAITAPYMYWGVWTSSWCSRVMTHKNSTILITYFTFSEGVNYNNVIKLPTTDLSGNTYGGYTFINLLPYMVFTPSTFTTDDVTPITANFTLGDDLMLTTITDIVFTTTITPLNI